LPEHSALTVEGQIERAAGVGRHVTRARDGRERPLRGSSWMAGFWVVAAAAALLFVVFLVLYLAG
jgi:hypothetical protein